MREIRFRAWVYYGEKLKKPHYSRDYDGLDRFFEDHSENDIDQCIELYTGLKDKNGKEIYGGDILDDGEGHIGEVLYNERLASFAYEWGNCGSTFMNLYTSDMKIIGNIHENPELLKREK